MGDQDTGLWEADYERPLSPKLNLTNTGLELGPCWMVSPHLFIASGSSETPSQQRPKASGPDGTGSPVLLGEGLQSSRDRGRAAPPWTLSVVSPGPPPTSWLGVDLQAGPYSSSWGKELGSSSPAGREQGTQGLVHRLFIVPTSTAWLQAMVFPQPCTTSAPDALRVSC